MMKKLGLATVLAAFLAVPAVVEAQAVWTDAGSVNARANVTGIQQFDQERSDELDFGEELVTGDVVQITVNDVGDRGHIFARFNVDPTTIYVQDAEGTAGDQLLLTFDDGVTEHEILADITCANGSHEGADTETGLAAWTSCNDGNTFTGDAGMRQHYIFIGGGLTVPADAAEGEYTGEISLTFTSND